MLTTPTGLILVFQSLILLFSEIVALETSFPSIKKCTLCKRRATHSDWIPMGCQSCLCFTRFCYYLKHHVNQNRLKFMVSKSLGKGARPKIPKMTPHEEISMEQMGLTSHCQNNNKNAQQLLWLFKASLLARLISQTSQLQDLIMWLPLTLQKSERVLHCLFQMIIGHMCHQTHTVEQVLDQLWHVNP